MIALLALSHEPAAAQLLPFVHYTPDGDRLPLPSAEVHKVHQDRLGFIWMAVYSSGLVRYDGQRVDVFTTEDGLRDLGVWDMIEDHAGRMWVASNAGLVVSDQPLDAYGPGERVRFVSDFKGIPLVNTIVGKNVMAVDKGGRIWIGTGSTGIVRYSTVGGVRADTLAEVVNGSPTPALRSLVARQDGTVWAGTRSGHLIVFENGSDAFQVWNADEGVPQQEIRTLYEDSEGRLYLGSRSGDIHEVSLTNGVPRFRLLESGLKSSIFDLTSSPGGALWAASQGSGIAELSGEGSARPYSRANGLLSDNVFDIMRDREGNLWFAQLGGVSKLRSDFRAFSGYVSSSAAGERPALPAPAVGAVEISRPGDSTCMVWAASQSGIACIQGDGTSRIIDRTDGLENDWVNGLAYDADGRLWIGTLQGVYSLSEVGLPTAPGGRTTGRLQIGGREMLLTSYGGPAILSVIRRPITIDHSESPTDVVWFVGNRELRGLVGGRWIIFGEASGLPPTVLHSAEMDADGFLWIGTRDHGLYRSLQPITGIVGGIIPSERADAEPYFEQVWTVARGAPSNEIYGLEAEGAGIWIGSPAGLSYLDRPSLRLLTHLSLSDGLPAANVMSLETAPSGRLLWVGTNGGLAAIDLKSRTVATTVTKQTGLLDNEVWFIGSVRVDVDGTVFYGTARGLAVYRPDEQSRNEIPPLLYIRDARLTQSNHGRNELTVEYAGLSFDDERRVRYKTRLLGYDDDWSEERSDSKVRYTNLPAYFTSKEYRFEALASNGDGLWTPASAGYSFSVLPPWWFRWWAAIVYVVMLSTAAFAVDRVQRGRVIRRERVRASEREAELKLEAALARSDAAEAEAKALFAENQRKEIELAKARELERAYDELRVMQEQLIAAEKLASLGELSAGIAHEIKNPLNFVNNFAELAEELIDDLQERIAALEAPSTDVLDDVNDIIENLKLNTKRIGVHGKRADGIVRSMLEHSEDRSGQREETDINGLADKILDWTANSLHGKGSPIVLERQYDEDAGTVVAVPQEIGRVLQNLINNAVYAAREQSEKTGSLPTVRLSTRRSNGHVKIIVQDNGPGIPPELRHRIFEPFFTTKPTGTGTGLGLSLCYSIVTKGHGGTLEVDSRSDEGAAFTVSLPASEHRSVAKSNLV